MSETKENCGVKVSLSERKSCCLIFGDFRSSSTYKDLFRTKRMRKITLLSMLLWMIISLVFDTTIRNVSNLSFNLYISFMVTIGMELPADLLSIVGLDWLGRRWSACIPMFACGITMIACPFIAGQSLHIKFCNTFLHAA